MSRSRRKDAVIRRNLAVMRAMCADSFLLSSECEVSPDLVLSNATPVVGILRETAEGEPCKTTPIDNSQTPT